MSSKKVRKLELDESNRTFYPCGKDALDFVRPVISHFIIELIEIANVPNPSDLSFLFINYKGFHTIALYKYRTRFLYQNGVYLLDTTDLPEFRLATNQEDFLFQVTEGIGKFNMTIYYTVNDAVLKPQHQ